MQDVQCKPGYKRCGWNCIKQNYNCKVDDTHRRRQQLNRAFYYGAMGAGLAVPAVAALHHSAKGNKAAAARNMKRFKDEAVSQAAWTAGAAATVGGLTYGLSTLNKRREQAKHRKGAQE